MKVIRNSVLWVVLMLVFVSRLVACPVAENYHQEELSADTEDQKPYGEFQNSVIHYLFAIQESNSAQNITEAHKLSSVGILPNQLIPFNFDFRSFASFHVPTTYNSPVPIYIRGHALLN